MELNHLDKADRTKKILRVYVLKRAKELQNSSFENQTRLDELRKMVNFIKEYEKGN